MSSLADPGDRERQRMFWGGFEDGEACCEDFLRSKVSVVVRNHHHRPDRICRVSFWRIRAAESVGEVFGVVLMMERHVVRISYVRKVGWS